MRSPSMTPVRGHYRLASRTVENEHCGVRPPALSTVSMPSSDDDKYIAVALGRFDALLGRGLRQILSEDPRLQIVDTDLDNAALERIVAQQAPLVALLDEESVAKPPVLARLRASQPTIEIVVLAHRPARACGMRLLAAGASRRGRKFWWSGGERELGCVLVDPRE